MAAPNPLTEQDAEDIDKALGSAQDAQEMIEQAQRAGIDVGEFKTRTDDARQRLLRIKQAYFPGRA